MRRFFFAPESPRLLALMRIGLALTLLYDAADHWQYVLELYSGVPVPIFPKTSFDPLVPSPFVAILSHSLLLYSLLMIVIGWEVRLSLWIAVGLTLWFGLLDLPGSFAKSTVVAIHLLLLLSFSRSAEVLSLQAWWNGRNRTECGLGPAWPRRLMQILICNVYFAAGIAKVHTPEFVSGDLLMYSLQDDRWGGTDLGLFFAAHHSWITAASLATVLFELFFPLLVWVGRMRLVMWGSAVAFHVTTGTLMNLGVFAPIMLAGLLAFLEERDLQGLAAIGRRLLFWRKTPAKASATAVAESVAYSTFSNQSISLRTRFVQFLGYLLCGAGCAGLGYAGQVHYDWYGHFRPQPLTLPPELDDIEAAMMMAEQQLREEDYFQRIEIGSRVKRARLFGDREKFQRGSKVYVLAQVIMPHPAIQLECLLLAPDGEEVGRFSQKLESAHSFTVRAFELTESLPAGRYRILLQANGYEVAQRTFELVDT